MNKSQSNTSATFRTTAYDENCTCGDSGYRCFIGNMILSSDQILAPSWKT